MTGEEQLQRIKGLYRRGCLSEQEYLDSVLAIPDIFDLLPEPVRPCPAPEELPSPALVITHAWSSIDSCTCPFPCAAQDLREGLPYTLTGPFGLRAHLLIREERRLLRGVDIDSALPMGRYLAEGWIEGYTAREGRRDPRIVIRTNAGGNVASLGFFRDGNDVDAFLAFPLWQPFFAWQRRGWDALREALLALAKESPGGQA